MLVLNILVVAVTDCLHYSVPWNFSLFALLRFKTLMSSANIDEEKTHSKFAFIEQRLMDMDCSRSEIQSRGVAYLEWWCVLAYLGGEKKLHDV
jgi:hypothetical protein